MTKFKVGDKVRVIKNTANEFEGVKIGDIGKVIDICDSGDYRIFLRINKHDEYGFKEKELELVEEDKMKKTFRKVIADINYMELWICRNCKFTNEVRIFKDKTGIQITDEHDNSLKWFSDKWEFELQRKEYTFEEAFKSYEEGKEIEDYRGVKYKKIDGLDHYRLECETDFNTRSSEDDYWFSFDEIRGKWYIND